MDDETRVLIEQLKRRTANLIHGQSLLEKAIRDADEDIASLKDMQSILTGLVNDHNVTITVLENKMPDFAKADQRLDEKLMFLDQKVTNLNLDQKIADSKLDLEQKVAILNLTLQSFRVKLEEMIREQDLNLLHLLSQRIDAIKIPEKVDVDAIKQEFSLRMEPTEHNVKLLQERIFQAEGRCLALEKRLENLALDVKRALLGRV